MVSHPTHDAFGNIYIYGSGENASNRRLKTSIIGVSRTEQT